jgi:hypothetical protein
VRRKVRDLIISDIQDTLKERFKFYLTEKEEYEEMDLKRLLIKIDLMFNTFLRECFGSYNT